LAAHPDRRRAALIATAVTVPVVVLIAFALTSHHSAKRSPPVVLSPVTVSAPRSNAAAASACEKVIERLPVTLDGLRPRTVHGSSAQVDTTYVVAWGDPAVILSCGVARPVQLAPGSTAQLFQLGQDDHNCLVLATHTKTTTIFTVVDRAAYVAIEVPLKITKDPTALLAALVAAALPAVCQAQSTSGAPVPDPRLCTHRP
jgi:Protein of unknown function (DUF3515)